MQSRGPPLFILILTVLVPGLPGSPACAPGLCSSACLPTMTIVHSEHGTKHACSVARHVPSVPPILSHDLRMRGNRIVSRETQANVVVFAATQPFVEPTDGE